MFEDLDEGSGFSPQNYGQPPKPNPPPPAQQSYGRQEQNQPPAQPQQSNSYNGGYQQNNGNQNGYQPKPPYQPRQQGSYQQGNSFGGFQRKEDVVSDAYIPVGMYVEKDFPIEVKDRMFNIASKLIAKKMTVRINGEDKGFVERLKTLTDEKLEIYLPWRGFNEIESKRTFNTLTSKHVASTSFLGWDKIPDSVKAILCSQVRLVFGDKNNSVVLCLITWSPDGASKAVEVTKETGRSSFIIKTASSYGFPVMNMMKPQAELIVEKTFSL